MFGRSSRTRELKLIVTRGVRRYIDDALGVRIELGRYKIGSGALLEAPCEVSRSAGLRGSFSIGAFSSISPTDCLGHNMHNVTIGRYCSLAAGVSIAPDEHPVHRITTHSLTYGGFLWATKFLGHGWSAQADLSEVSRSVVIGNDVWVGCHAFIRGGLKIGDGAVIAAHAVVTKDVPPYAIVAGVPARIVKYRFDEVTIRELQELQWWRYDIGKIGGLDWNDVKGCIGRIKECIANGVRPYEASKITIDELRPYARSTLFFVDIGSRRLRLKLFGLWLLHIIFARRERVQHEK